MLAHWGVTGQAEYEIRAIVSELVTNSVVHSASESASLTITLLGRTVCLEVRDAGTWREQKHDPTGERGRGLALVRQQATTSGVQRTLGGTRVWAQRVLTEDELPHHPRRPACRPSPGRTPSPAEIAASAVPADSLATSQGGER